MKNKFRLGLFDDPFNDYAELEALARDAIAEEACFSLRSLAVNGRDLLDAGYAPGPALGQALETLLDAVTDGRVPNEKAALLAFLAAPETAASARDARLARLATSRQYSLKLNSDMFYRFIVWR